MASVPYSSNSLREALHILQSQSVPAEHVKSAERAILKWEEEGDTLGPFVKDLLALLASSNNSNNEYENINASSRSLLVLLILKNLIYRRWKIRGRRSIAATSSLSEDDKEYIRMFLMRQYVEVDPQRIITMTHSKAEWMAVAALIAKIARFDLPLVFHDLIPKLVQSMSLMASGYSVSATYIPSSCEHLIGPAVGSAIILNEILEELLTKRLLVDKKYFSTMAVDVFSNVASSAFLPQLEYVVDIFGKSSKESNLYSANEGIRIQLFHTSVLLRIIRSLLLGGLTSLMDLESTKIVVDQVMSAILELLVNHLSPILINCLSDVNKVNDDLLEDASSLFIQATESLVEIQARYSLKFVAYLQPFMELAINLLCQSSEQVMVNNSEGLLFLLPIMRFLANIISSSDYSPDETSNESICAYLSQTSINGAMTSKGDRVIDISSIDNAVRTVWLNVLTPAKINDLIKVIVCKYMRLSKELLEEWSCDAESFYLIEKNASADEKVYAAAQNLYLSIMESSLGKKVAIPLITEMIGNSNSQAEAISLEKSYVTEAKWLVNEIILVWDAIYTAIGISVHIFSSHIDFSDWFGSCLAPALKNLSLMPKAMNSLPILRRRIIWLIGCHSNCASASSALHSDLISCLTDLSPESNNDIAVKLSAVEALLSIVYEPEFNLDALRRIMADLIRSLYNLLLWCNELESKQLILSLITCFLGLYSQGSLNNEVANEATSPLNSIWYASNDQNILRKEVICIMKSIATGVGSERSELLYSSVGPMIIYALDPVNVDECLYLIDEVLSLWLSLLRLAMSYNSFLDTLYPSLKNVFERDFDNLQASMLITEGYILLGGQDFLRTQSAVVDRILNSVIGQVRPRGASYVMLVLESLLRKCPTEGINLLLESGVIHTMLVGCTKNYHRAENSEEDQIIIYYLSVLARALSSSPQIFDSLFPVNCNMKSMTAILYSSNLLDLFWQKYDHVNHLLWKKIWIVFFFVQLPPTNSCFSEFVIHNLDGVINNSVDYLLEERLRGESFLLDRNFEDQSDIAPEVGTERYRELVLTGIRNDPIFGLNLPAFIKSKLEKLRQVVGEQTYGEILSSVEPVLLQQLNGLI